MDRSNGYESAAAEFPACRGSTHTSAGIGRNTARTWARSLSRGAAVIDLGCGAGLPMTEVPTAERLNVFALDASPSFIRAFLGNFPDTPAVCEAVQDSKFFDRTFDGVLAWGLLFLLSADEQYRLLRKMAGILTPGRDISCTLSVPVSSID